MDRILDAIKKARSVLIVGHVRPDGDCLGSAFALREFCRNAGKIADAGSPSPVPEAYGFIRNIEDFNVFTLRSYDLFIAVDCATKDRLGRLEGYFRSAKDTACIDHHEGHRGFANNNRVVNTASSTCEIIYDMLAPTGRITPVIADYLFMGLSTDTGHFMHSNTTAKVLYTAYKLEEAGADCHALASVLYRTRSRNKTMLIAKSIEAMRFYMDGRLAVIPLTQKLLSECEINSNDTEGIIDYAIAVKGVEIGVSMCEEKTNEFKVSFRSRGRDVNEIAGVFGGGGHIYAAGCRISGRTEDVIDKIIKAVRDGEKS